MQILALFCLLFSAGTSASSGRGRVRGDGRPGLRVQMNLDTRSTPERFASFSKKRLDVGGKAVLALGGAALLTGAKRVAAEDAGGISVKALPYSVSALEPFLDTRTMEIHHDKHYGGYVAKVNALVKGGSLSAASLLQIMDDSYSKNKNEGLYNVAAQSWNHEFYFAGLSPSGGGEPKEGTKAAALVKKSFGDYASFRKEFATAGGNLFGSGWVWLVLNQQGKLDIVKTSNALNPLQTQAKGTIPLLTMDVWEHAYYLLHQNRRPEYVDTFLDHLINWDFVESNIPSSVKFV